MQAFTKGDGDFTNAQRSPGAHDYFENNFETPGLGREFQQPRATDRKKAAHRIVQTGKRVG
jgi:hypothetical protein